jgi:OOP family OmpA-OmpF porin
MNNTLLVYPFALSPSTMLRTGLSKGCSHHDEASTSSARTGLHKAPHYLLAALITLTLSALASIAHADNRPTTAENLATIERLQRTLQQREFSRTGNPYALAKAGAWLDFALDEYYEPDRSGIVQDATDEAAVILAQLDAQPGFDASATPHPYASERVRDDLWQQVATMKQHPDFACASEKTAELEVQLVWTGHEKWEAGWSQAEPYARIAENLAVEAQQQLDACAQKHASITHTVVEQRSLSTDALFAFGRAGIDDLAPGGRQKLDALADELKTWKSLEHIQLSGHTDRLGSDRYNQKLSQQRADTIKHYLAGRDIRAEVIEATGRGESQPIVQCHAQRDSHALIECLQPNRRVELIISGQRN